ncbi:7709_t:CDS:2 [Paraglomus brasilianum]|uniref:7709_t:CDS:1 n=1 Tax=Paraglomus brasilianum TaxID=144538 RepID=A0A9N9GI42_9GLOM|nr:7709_t:CDS:2 [Paraglomus brasilianum]
MSQSLEFLENKCERWMKQQYVRYALGIKLYERRTTRDTSGRFNRSMIAKLWTRTALAVNIPVPPVPGVFVQTWDFGTLLNGTDTSTTCTSAGLPAYQIIIPVSEVFWDPPIVRGVPVIGTHFATSPAAVTATHFTVDLYLIQQAALDAER